MTASDIREELGPANGRSAACARAAADRLWSLVLAGGDGERTRPFIERWLGRHRPKQYCTFVGTRSLLQHTIDRADRLGPARLRVTVVARAHERDAVAQLAGRGGRLVFQPANRGTAAGVFLPLTYVRAEDPEATVVIYPADHFVWPETRFTALMARAVAESRACPDQPILLGVVPDSPETDYGWILPDGPNVEVPACRRVRAFREKPSSDEAKALMAAGALWNTLVMVARVDTLWQLGRQSCPEVIERFDAWSTALGTSDELPGLEALYADMPLRSFSADLLEPSAAQLAVFEVREVRWSDWGRPERIVGALAAIGRTPVCVLDGLVQTLQRAGYPPDA